MIFTITEILTEHYVCSVLRHPGPPVRRQGQAWTSACQARLSEELLARVPSTTGRASGATCWLLWGSARPHVSSLLLLFFREIRIKDPLLCHSLPLSQLNSSPGDLLLLRLQNAESGNLAAAPAQPENSWAGGQVTWGHGFCGTVPIAPSPKDHGPL